MHRNTDLGVAEICVYYPYVPKRGAVCLGFRTTNQVAYHLRFPIHTVWVAAVTVTFLFLVKHGAFFPFLNKVCGDVCMSFPGVSRVVCCLYISSTAQDVRLFYASIDVFQLVTLTIYCKDYI